MVSAAEKSFTNHRFKKQILQHKSRSKRGCSLSDGLSTSADASTSIISTSSLISLNKEQNSYGSIVYKFKDHLKPELKILTPCSM